MMMTVGYYIRGMIEEEEAKKFLGVRFNVVSFGSELLLLLLLLFWLLVLVQE